MTGILPPTGVADAFVAEAKPIDALAPSARANVGDSGSGSAALYTAQRPDEASDGAAGALASLVCRGAVVLALWLGH